MFLSLWATIDWEFSAEPANPLALLVIDVKDENVTLFGQKIAHTP